MESSKQNEPDRGQINFRYPPERVKMLKDRAKGEGVKVSALIARLCDEYLGIKPKEILNAEDRLARIEQKLEDIEGKLAA